MPAAFPSYSPCVIVFVFHIKCCCDSFPPFYSRLISIDRRQSVGGGGDGYGEQLFQDLNVDSRVVSTVVLIGCLTFSSNNWGAPIFLVHSSSFSESFDRFVDIHRGKLSVRLNNGAE